MRRRVTVDSTKSVRDSAAESRRPSVFERLGPGGGPAREHRDSSRQDQCRNWLRDGDCPYGNTCHFEHGPYSRGKDRLSDTEPPMDLRHRVESKRAERERHERDAWEDDRSPSPPMKEEKRRRSRHKDGSEKKKKKKKREMSSMVVKQESPSSSSSEDGHAKDWPAQDEEDQHWGESGDNNPDFEYARELTLEKRRQQLQRELERMELEEDQPSDMGGREALEDDNSSADERPSKSAASSPPRKKHGKKKRSHSNNSKHDRQQTGDEMEGGGGGGKSSKSHKKHSKHSADLSPRRDADKTTEHHSKKKSHRSKSPASRNRSPSPSPVKSKPGDTPTKKHKTKDGKKKAKKRKYQSDSSDDNDAVEKKRSSSTSRGKKGSSRRHQSPSPSRSPSASPQRGRAKQRRGHDPSPSSQSDSSDSSPSASRTGSYASQSPKRSRSDSRKKKRYASPSPPPPPKRSRQPSPESSTQSRHSSSSRRVSPDNKSRHSHQSANRGQQHQQQSPQRKKRARSGSIGSSQRSQSPSRDHRSSPSPRKQQQGSSGRGRGSPGPPPGRDASVSRDKGGRGRPGDRMPPDAGRSKGGYDNKYDNKRSYSQDSRGRPANQQRDGRQMGRDGQGRDMPGGHHDMPGGGRDMPGGGRDMQGRDMMGGRDRDMGRDPRGDMPPGRERDNRGYPPPQQQVGGKDGGRPAPPPGPPGRGNERASRRDDWEKKRTRDGRDPPGRDEPYSKRARGDTRGGMSPSSQQQKQRGPYGREGGARDDDGHSLDVRGQDVRGQAGGRYGGAGVPGHQRSGSAVQQLRQDRDRERSSSSSRSGRRPGDFPPPPVDSSGGGRGNRGGGGGRDNTPDFRRGSDPPPLRFDGGRGGRDGGGGRDGTPDARRGPGSGESRPGRGRVEGRENTPDARRQDYPPPPDSGGRKGGRDMTPDKRQQQPQDYDRDGGKKGRDATQVDVRRPEHHLEVARGSKGRSRTPDDRKGEDRRRSDKGAGGGGKYDEKRDVRKYDERDEKDPGIGREHPPPRETTPRERDDQRDSSSRGSRSSSRGPPPSALKIKQEPEPVPPPEPSPTGVPTPVKVPELDIKREKLKIKTESLESKMSSSAGSEPAKDSPAGLERKFSRFSEPFSDWSDEGSDGLLTRSSTPLEHVEQRGNRQLTRPSRGGAAADPPLPPGPAEPTSTGTLDPIVTKQEMTPADINAISEQIRDAIKKEPGLEDESAAAPNDSTKEPAAIEEIAPPPSGDVFQSTDAYEEISDDDEFLDDILEENKEELQATAEKSVTEVDWASLTKDIQPIVVQDASDAGGDGETKVSILERFKPANVLTRVGVSRALAGSALMKEIEAMCQRPGGENKSDDKDATTQSAPPLFEEQLGALNATAHRRYERRKRLLTDIGPCRRALCARRDIMIRKQLRKDKDSEQVFNNPVIDTELYRLSLQLFRTKRPSLVSPLLESKDSGLVLKSISVSS